MQLMSGMIAEVNNFSFRFNAGGEEADVTSSDTGGSRGRRVGGTVLPLKNFLLAGSLFLLLLRPPGTGPADIRLCERQIRINWKLITHLL